MATEMALERAAPIGMARGSFDPWTSDRVITVGIWVAFALVIGQLVTQVVDFQLYGLRIGALDSDTHWSVFGVASLIAQGFAAAAAATRGVSTARRGGWFLLSAIVASLLVIRAALPDDPALLAAPLAVVFVMLWSFTSTDPTRPRRLVRVALLLLLFSFVVHIVGLKIVESLGYGYNSWPYELKGILKHSSELAGWSLVGVGLLAVRRYTAPLGVRRSRHG